MSNSFLLNHHRIRKFLIGLFSSFLFSSLCFGGGNAKLMEQQHNRAFLLNKEILSTLDTIEGQAKISFSGSVVRGADGKLKIKIDSVDGVTPYALSRSMSDRTKIEYITFEEMLGKQSANSDEKAKPIKEKADQEKLMYGGGSVTH